MLKKRMARWLAGGAIAMASVLASVFLVTPASAAVTHHVYRTCSTAGGCGMWLRTTPTPAANHVGLMADGDVFSINCWQLGPATYGNPVWEQGTWKGKTGWAMDYYIDTHWQETGDLTAQGMPQCGVDGPAPTPAPPPSGTTTAEKSAMNWATLQKAVNPNTYNLMCLAFTFDAYSKSSGMNLRPWVNYSINGNTYPQDIWGKFNHGHTGVGTPPAGALVFFNATAGHDRTYSHVALSMGGGNLISSGDSINRSLHSETMTQRVNAHLFNSYVGWWTPDQ